LDGPASNERVLTDQNALWLKSARAKARQEITSHFQESAMAETDLDAVIRGIGKTQHKALMAEAKKRHARLAGLAGKAKTKEGKARFKQTAKDMMLLANAAARRLQITAENAADSYARAMKNALEEIKTAEAKAATAKSNAVKSKAAKKKA
jgi:hypothetical protein